MFKIQLLFVYLENTSKLIVKWILESMKSVDEIMKKRLITNNN